MTALLAASGAGPPARGDAAVPVFFVSPDPDVGKDEPSAGESPQRPFLTIAYALERAAEKVLAPDYEGPRGARFELRAGTYAASDPDAPQRFPALVPVALERVEIAGEAAGNGTRLVAGPAARGPVLELPGYPADRSARIELRDLAIEGGTTGVYLGAVSSEDLDLTIANCSFLGQAARGLEVFCEPGAKVSLSLSDCTFQDGKGGFLAISPWGGKLDLTVEKCAFVGVQRYAPGNVLGSGVDLYVEPHSEVRASVTRSVFRGVASAVQLTEADESEAIQPSGGSLEALVANNVVNGLPGSEPPSSSGVLDGVYLNLWPHHANQVVVANNTFVGIERFVVYHDNLFTLRERGLEVPGITFLANVVKGIGGESEFDEEVFVFMDGEPGEDFPAPACRILSNILEKSVLGLLGYDGNFTGDPGFVDEASFDFRLADGAPAIDRGESPWTEDVDVGPVDFGGQCRRSFKRCALSLPRYPVDIGAFEHQDGNCVYEPGVFTRGACRNGTGAVVITDAIFLFGYLFLGSSPPPCADACDSNDDGTLNISDGIYTLSFLFSGGPSPPPPFGGEAGPDPTRDCLGPCGAARR